MHKSLPQGPLPVRSKLGCAATVIKSMEKHHLRQVMSGHMKKNNQSKPSEAAGAAESSSRASP